MYFQHFGLSQPPFKITPDTSLFYPGGNRGAVLEALVYAVASGEGIVKVVGEVGSGKTMLCRMLELELPEYCEIVYLANPGLSREDILHAIAFELGLAVAEGDNRLQVMQRLQQYLLGRHAEGKRVVVFVEEAQGMPLDTLEEIRLLSNLETSQDKLLQIVLFGQPELDELLTAHGIRQLRERITYSFELEPLGGEEVRDYVRARLRASGQRAGELFERGAVRELTRYSHGLLRRINILADKALLAAYAANAGSVKAEHVRRAARDSEFTAKRRLGWRWPLAAGVTAVAAVVAAAAWLLHTGAAPAPADARAAPGEATGVESAAAAPAGAGAPGAPGASGAPPGAAAGLPPGLVRIESLEPVLEDQAPPRDAAELAARMRRAGEAVQP